MCAGRPALVTWQMGGYAYKVAFILKVVIMSGQIFLVTGQIYLCPDIVSIYIEKAIVSTTVCVQVHAREREHSPRDVVFPVLSTAH